MKAIQKDYIKFNNLDAFVDFVHISDVARGICAAINSKYNGVINLGYGLGHYLRDIQNFIHNLLKCDSKEGTTKDNINTKHGLDKYEQSKHGPVLDISLSKQILDYSPVISLETGLKELIKVV